MKIYVSLTDLVGLGILAIVIVAVPIFVIIDKIQRKKKGDKE